MTARTPADTPAPECRTPTRERAIDVPKATFAEGRLTREEHAERVERAYGSRTYAELAAVSGDLPAGPPGALPPPAQHDPARSLPRPAGRAASGLALAALNILLTVVLVFVAVANRRLGSGVQSANASGGRAGAGQVPVPVGLVNPADRRPVPGPAPGSG